MPTPNERLRGARERVTSPYATGLPLSRAELADLVNKHVYEQTQRVIELDANYIGKLERGQIRWPQAVYRDGLRAVLGVGTDTELGFSPPRRIPALAPTLEAVDRNDFLQTSFGPDVSTAAQALPSSIATVRPAPQPAQGPSAGGSVLASATETAAGTCGELVQGFTAAGVPFHVTCPIARTATVTVTVRPAAALTITQIGPGLSKVAQAIRHTARLLGLDQLEVQVEHWSDLDIGKGMGSSTADIVAAARALAAAADQTLSPAQLASIATAIESSDGSMYPGLVAFNHKTGDVLEQFSWWPQFVILMITPDQRFNTESADFSGKERFGSEFDDILDKLRKAAAQQDASAFAQAATRSASINQQFVPNPYHALIANRIDEFGALGINVGHTGTVLGLLFDARDPLAIKAAASASVQLQQLLPGAAKMDITLTPTSPV